MREIKIIAAAEDAGARIDKYISEQEDLSRSRAGAAGCGKHSGQSECGEGKL